MSFNTDIEQLIFTVSQHWAAWNNQDINIIFDTLTEDCIYTDTSTGIKYHREDLANYLEDQVTRYPNFQYKIISSLPTADNTIITQWLWAIDPNVEFTTSSTKEKGLYLNGVSFFKLRGDKICSFSSYYDTSSEVALRKKISLTESSSENKKNQHKYQKSSLDEDTIPKFLDQIKGSMISEKWYLDSDVSLPILADKLSLSTNHLSQIINCGFGVNFFDFINEHRIEAAKQMMSDKKYEELSILEIGTMVGFNSNSAFYAAFQKIENTTPSRYRKSLRVK